MPKPTSQAVVSWLRALDFEEPQAGDTEWRRHFDQHDYSLLVDIDQETITYGQGIIVHRNTVTNFHDSENFVVLECVCSLLARGYSPASIKLEKPFPLGHSSSGYLDVLVELEGRSYAMIECKTYGPEFKKALKALKTKPASQLMTYIQQDRAAQHAILYSSRQVSGKVERDYAGLECASLLGANTRELFDSWDKETYTSGLFEAEPYAVAEHSITIGDLKDLTNSDGQALFNSFKETLRRHAVSDLPNAFNKLFNLIICKILDEDKIDPEDVTEFQWGTTERPAAVLERLSRLYERSMREYLNLDVMDSHARASEVLQGLDEGRREEVERLLADLRQYTNMDFAFVDVFDERSYNQNALIVKDLVRLLQDRRLRYTQKHGFMGLFFERLLNTSMKQESGQFFTPPPLAQFVNEALPLESIIARKLAGNSSKFLPYAIDYAAGSGHFLTEYMDRIDRILAGYNESDFSSQSQRRNFRSWKDELTWAGEFVYGVELDHRLAKTAKISTFLHGDGDANVVQGNGLASFSEESAFSAAGPLLKSAKGGKDNSVFDVVVANPPYSVSGFAQLLSNGNDSFDLWPYKGESSDKIECFFIERTKQLLVEGGVAGIILPASFLNNKGIDTRARRLLLTHFDLVAVVSLGTRVFVATDIPCVIVFIRRRSNSRIERIDRLIDNYIKTGKDQSVEGVVNAFEMYAARFHSTTAADYHTALEAIVDTGIPSIDAYEWAYANRSRKVTPTRDKKGGPTKDLRAHVLQFEKERMAAYFSVFQQYTLLANAPTKKRDQEKFLGYSFSERRRHEGIRFQSGTAQIVTPLFDPEDSSNPGKISTVIKKHFKQSETDGSSTVVPSVLSEWVSLYETESIVDWSVTDFSWGIQNSAPTTALKFSGATKPLGKLCNLRIGSTPTRERPDFFDGDLPWLKIGDIDTSKYPSESPVITETDERITTEASKRMLLVPAGTLVMSFKLSIGNTAYTGVDMYMNEAIVTLDVKDAPSAEANSWVDVEFVDVLLRRCRDQVLSLGGLGNKKFGRTLNLQVLRSIPIPVGDDAFRDVVKSIDKDPNLTDQQKSSEIASKLWT